MMGTHKCTTNNKGQGAPTPRAIPMGTNAAKRHENVEWKKCARSMLVQVRVQGCLHEAVGEGGEGPRKWSSISLEVDASIQHSNITNHTSNDTPVWPFTRRVIEPSSPVYIAG